MKGDAGLRKAQPKGAQEAPPLMGALDIKCVNQGQGLDPPHPPCRTSSPPLMSMRYTTAGRVGLQQPVWEGGEGWI